MNKNIYLIIIIIIAMASIAGYLFYNQDQPNFSLKHQACLNSGGEVVTAECCKETEDFPNQCQIGACGCAPKNSHQVKACDCGEGKCFNGEQCTQREEIESEVNFEEKGYLVKYEEKWALNYEEPGKPALVVTLQFDKESKCDLVQGEKPCSEYESYGEVGDRVKVIGEKENGMVRVTELIFQD